MSDDKNKRDKSQFFVLFVDDDFYNASHDYDYLYNMANKIKNSTLVFARKAKLVIHEYHRDKFVSEPYSYNP